MYWALSFVIIASYMIYSVVFVASKQVRLAKPGFTHMWQTLEVISTLVIPVMLHSHPLYDWKPLKIKCYSYIIQYLNLAS